MARKKKAPKAETVVNISLTEVDLVAKGTELANRMKRIAGLKKQKAEQNAHMQTLIDDEIELADAIASQIIGGTEARNQASLKANEAGELEVPEKPFDDPKGDGDADPLPTLTPEDAARIEAEKVAEGLKVPPAVADAIAKNGGEVDLSAGKAANDESLIDLADAATRKKPRGKKQPPRAQAPAAHRIEPVAVTGVPASCADCGGRVIELDGSGVYSCQDEYETGCVWTAVVESSEATKALGPLSQHASA